MWVGGHENIKNFFANVCVIFCSYKQYLITKVNFNKGCIISDNLFQKTTKVPTDANRCFVVNGQEIL